MTTNTQPAEAGHWYKRDGTPAYMTERADRKGLRPTTLRDARIHDLVPSVTGIIRMAAAPGLESWKQEQVLMSALTLPRHYDETETAWLDRVRADAREQARKAAERGTIIHAAVQIGLEGGRVDPDYLDLYHAAAEALEREYGRQNWICERAFAHPAGFGGKVDIHAPGEVIDIKTTERPLEAIAAYDEHAMQLAAYREGLKMPSANAAILYISTTERAAKVVPVDQDALARGWEMFQCLLSFWQAKNRHGGAA